jgi:hypothetical protein
MKALLGLFLLVGLFLLAGRFVPAADIPADLPANPPPRWWKGNLHTHSLWDGGDDFPEMIVSWYREKGYHFLGLSEHNVFAKGERWRNIDTVNRDAGVDAVAKYRARFGDSWVQIKSGREVRLKPVDEYRMLFEERDRFLLLPAEELTGEAGDGRSLHMNVSNVGEELPYLSTSTIPDTILANLQQVAASSRRTGRPALFHVNHPNYNWSLTAEDLARLVDLEFVEIWNGVEGDNDPGEGERISSEAIWDVANTLRLQRRGTRPLLGLATDDSHDHHGNKSRSRPGRAWLMVRSRYLSPEHLFAAMRRGDFYSTTGVSLGEVNFDPNNRTLSVRIEGKAGETFVTRFIGSRRGVNLEGKPRRDAQGQLLETTLDYRSASGPQMGELFAEVSGTTATYKMRGDELYVRAVVTSSARTEVPSSEFAFQRAWTQPVGWREK